jgi:hypothetical protein
MKEDVLYNNPFVGYKITKSTSSLAECDVNFYFVKDKTNTLQFSIWVHDLAEILDVLIDIVQKAYDYDTRYEPKQMQVLRERIKKLEQKDV